MSGSVLNATTDKGEEWQNRMRAAEEHMSFIAKIYRMQIAAGRYFIHEHPSTATSWRLPVMRKLLKTPGVMSTVAHQCEYGLRSRDCWGEGPAKKPTPMFGVSSGCTASTTQTSSAAASAAPHLHPLPHAHTRIQSHDARPLYTNFQLGYQP